ncbi:MAG: hypothetical protein PVH17_11425, partial [Anaerolineae bacterium]
LDMRYVGQSFELAIDTGDWMLDVEQTPTNTQSPISSIQSLFHEAHRQRFSYASEGEPVEIVNLRLKAIGRTAKPRFSEQPPGKLDPKAAHIGYKQVHFADADTPNAARPVPTALYERERLLPGNIVVGPAVIFQLDTTTVIPPGWSATVDGWGNLVAEGRGV